MNYPVPAQGVLEGVVTGEDASGQAIVTIEQIHGDGGGYAVGGTFVISAYGASEGRRVLAPIGSDRADDAGAQSDAGAPSTLAAVLLDDEGVHQCSSQSVAQRPVSRDLFLAAVQSSDCAGTLAAADSSWADNSCSGGGCAASGADASGPTTLGILIAIVSALAMRGRARRRDPAE